MVLRVPGQGMPSTDPGGVPGDLFVVMHINPDERFERRGIDLWQHVMISVEDGVLGTQIEVPTLQEPFRLDIPAGTQPEAVLRLRNAFSAYPNDEVAAHLGEVLWSQGRHGEAEKIWQEGLQLKPDSDMIQRTRERLQAR